MIYQENLFPFEPNDVLVVCSDGVIEAQREHESFGIERLLEHIKTVAHLSAEGIGLTLYEAVLRFSLGFNQNDDMTVLVLKGE
jgi:serine phosphatase RsbU (regulator of sigma subunit)